MPCALSSPSPGSPVSFSLCLPPAYPTLPTLHTVFPPPVSRAQGHKGHRREDSSHGMEGIACALCCALSTRKGTSSWHGWYSTNVRVLLGVWAWRQSRHFAIGLRPTGGAWPRRNVLLAYLRLPTHLGLTCQLPTQGHLHKPTSMVAAYTSLPSHAHLHNGRSPMALPLGCPLQPSQPAPCSGASTQGRSTRGPSGHEKGPFSHDGRRGLCGGAPRLVCGAGERTAVHALLTAGAQTGWLCNVASAR
ncbi:hypothetical protein LCGC14_1337230 [marine sediment metagenome]|uniref:Uncharacterized protein n=1 Tax=marine sediment metagenome TaxID=412755 RepID=A0A0F9MVL1_9ZZZZ